MHLRILARLRRLEKSRFELCYNPTSMSEEVAQALSRKRVREDEEQDPKEPAEVEDPESQEEDNDEDDDETSSKDGKSKPKNKKVRVKKIKNFRGYNQKIVARVSKKNGGHSVSSEAKEVYNMLTLALLERLINQAIYWTNYKRSVTMVPKCVEYAVWDIFAPDHAKRVINYSYVLCDKFKNYVPKKTIKQ